MGKNVQNHQYHPLSDITCVCRQAVETQEGQVVHHPLRSPKKHSTTVSQRSTGSVCYCHQPQRREARLMRHTYRTRDKKTGTVTTERCLSNKCESYKMQSNTDVIPGVGRYL